MHKKEYFPIGFWVFFSIQLLFISNSLAQQGNEDFYTDIAKTKYQERYSFPMERPGPFELPHDKVVSWEKQVGKAFVPMAIIETEEQVDAALAKLRAKHQVFLKDIAPKSTEARKRLNISAMQFRYETNEDQKDFNYTLSGKGKWQNITIPYYHGPQGPSTAYYRTEFELDISMLGQEELFLHFNGADSGLCQLLRP